MFSVTMRRRPTKPLWMTSELRSLSRRYSVGPPYIVPAPVVKGVCIRKMYQLLFGAVAVSYMHRGSAAENQIMNACWAPNDDVDVTSPRVDE